MKFLKILIVFLSVMSFVSCSSDDDGDTGGAINAENGQLVARVSGDSFTSSEVATTAQLQNGNLAITGVNSDGDTISININDFESQGTFDLSGSSNEGLAIYLPNGDNTFYNSINAGGSGSITVSNVNTEAGQISGSFNFIATRTESNGSNDAVEISDGSFLNIAVTGLTN